MVPRQPIEHDLVPACRFTDGLKALGRVGRKIIKGDRHDLGQARRARGQHQGCAVLGLQARNRGGNLLGHRGCKQVGIGRRRTLQQVWRGGHHQRIAKIKALERLGGHGRVFGKDDTRMGLGDHVGQAAIVAAHGGIGGADRADRQASGLGGKAHDREGWTIARQDQNWRAGFGMVEEPLRRRVHVLFQLGKGQIGPLAIRSALGHRPPIRRLGGPLGIGQRDVGLIGP